MFEVGTDETVTRLYMYTRDSFVKTSYRERYIITDHEVMHPAITGSMAVSGWVENEILELVVTYNYLVDDGTKE